MRFVYLCLIHLLAPLMLAGRWLRGLRRPEYRRRLGERLGLVPAPAEPVAVWLHAVSVGEVLAALPLIRALVRTHGPRRVWVTSTTPQGSERVRMTLGDQVLHSYLPLDLPFAVSRFLDRARPAKAVIVETEIWPVLFRALRRRRIPLLIVNARLSQRSVAGYGRVAAFARSVFDDITQVAAQSEADAQRFSALGARQVSCAGNIKFEAEPDPSQVESGRSLRAQLGAARPVWIAASTHAGEETAALDAHRALLRTHPEALLILVPRHAQRFEEVAEEISRKGFIFSRRSRGEADAERPVMLGDSMGEMWRYLAASDLAFVGGSLVGVGGHNVLEPAALGVPVLFGPFMSNFVEAREVLLDCGAAREVADAAGLGDAVNALMNEGARRADMGAAGQAAIERNRGTLQRLLALIEQAA